MSKDTFYTPGVCNINQPEVAYRRKVGHVFAAITVALVGFMVALNQPLFAIGVFITAFSSAISYLQAKNNFCVAYAAAGKFNASAEYADTKSVASKNDRAKDKAKSNTMYRQAALIAVVVAVLSYFIAA